MILGEVVPSVAGPKRPQDRIALDNAAAAYSEWLSRQIDVADVSEEADFVAEGGDAPVVDEDHASYVKLGDNAFNLEDGAVVIAAITSCTNTSNPSVLIAAGLVAKKALAKGLKVPSYVKPSLSPGSHVVSE